MQLCKMEQIIAASDTPLFLVVVFYILTFYIITVIAFQMNFLLTEMFIVRKSQSICNYEIFEDLSLNYSILS